jgi:hypothetical protein
MLGKYTLASTEFQCKIKNIDSLFDFIKQNVVDKYNKIEQISDNTLLLNSRRLLRRDILSIEDIVELNTINIEISSEIIIIPDSFRKWLDKRFLRLKNSVWLVLFLIMSILIPIIAVGYIGERFQMMRVFGIVLLCSAGLFYILFALFNLFFSKRRIKQKTQASEEIEIIKEIILEYSEKEISGIMCWNCFSEIKKNEKICPKCKVSLSK